MRKTSLLLFSFVFVFSVSAQKQKEWFPAGLNIQPFAANFLEARAGFNYQLAERNIRLDIGTSSDIYKVQDGNKTLSFGADLFTYTKLRSESSFKFPVEAIDYLFGVNSGYKMTDGNKEYGFRFRFAHISAHLVDGSYNQANNPAVAGWRNGRSPFVYSREFLELFPFYRINGFRVYTGLTYLFHVVPSGIGKGIYQIGFDNYFINFPVKALTPFIGYDFKLQKTGAFTGSNIITGGVKFGKWNEKGFSISLSYFSGKSVHGEFYDLNESYATLGFNMEL